jgi:hypothetical protein
MWKLLKPGIGSSETIINNIFQKFSNEKIIQPQIKSETKPPISKLYFELNV